MSTRLISILDLLLYLYLENDIDVHKILTVFFEVNHSI